MDALDVRNKAPTIRVENIMYLPLLCEEANYLKGAVGTHMVVDRLTSLSVTFGNYLSILRLRYSKCRMKTKQNICYPLIWAQPAKRP